MDYATKKLYWKALALLVNNCVHYNKFSMATEFVCIFIIQGASNQPKLSSRVALNKPNTPHIQYQVCPY